jgi:hypothetical protein
MTDDHAPDPQRLIKLARQTLSSAERRPSSGRSIFSMRRIGIRHS